jgi:hypothetical protein
VIWIGTKAGAPADRIPIAPLRPAPVPTSRLNLQKLNVPLRSPCRAQNAIWLRPPPRCASICARQYSHAPGAALRLLESSPLAISEKVPTTTILRLNWRGVKVWFTGTLT